MITIEQYRKIQDCMNQGTSISEAARRLNLSTTTIRSWWKKSEEDFLKMQNATAYELDSYRQFIVELVKTCPQIGTRNVLSRLQEEFPDFNFSYNQFRRYLKDLRTELGINYKKRHTTVREELPPGYEAQVDFGQFKMRNMYGKETKVYFFCMILSYSRMKYVYFSPDPFTTKTAIEAHKLAFQYFGGRPQVIMYDQDRVFVVSENYGNIILVKEFDEFVKEAGFSVYLCKTYDPETKGKVENTVRFVKQGFLEGRTYCGIDRLNCDCLGWLDRIGNGILNDYTKKSPREMFTKESYTLTKVRFAEKPQPKVLTMYNGFIAYNDNRYEMPQDLVNEKDRIRVEVQEDTLLFYIALTNELVCKHMLCTDKGQTIKLPTRKRQFHALEVEITNFYKDNSIATEYLIQMKLKQPRYIVAQLRKLKKLSTFYTEGQMNVAFKFCVDTLECTIPELMSFLIYKYGKDTMLDCTNGRIEAKNIKRSQEIREAFNGTDY